MKFLLSLLFMTSIIFAQDTIVTRAAFDLGSGFFKVMVADVDTRNFKILKTHAATVEFVGLGHDFAASADGNLSEAVQAKAFAALSKFKELAVEHGATAYTGIATAVFRKAANGQELLSRLLVSTGIPLNIVSQKLEGVVGFNTAAALAGEFDREAIISWDSGNASFQIASLVGDELEVYQGPLGDALAQKEFVTAIRQTQYTTDNPINPVSHDEMTEFMAHINTLVETPAWLSEKLSGSATVVAIGDEFSLFAMPAKYLKVTEFTLADVELVYSQLVGKTNDDPVIIALDHNKPAAVVLRLAMLQTLMNRYGIAKIVYRESAGSTPGLLISPEFWQTVQA